MSDENNKNLLEINNDKEVEEFKKLKGELAAYKTFDNIYDAFIYPHIHEIQFIQTRPKKQWYYQSQQTMF